MDRKEAVTAKGNRQPQKVIFIVSALHGGGAERVITLLATECAKRKIDTTICMAAGDVCDYALPEDVKLVRLGGESKGNPLVKLKRIIALRGFIKANRHSKLIAFSTSINIQAIIAALGFMVDLSVSERNDPDRCSYKGLRNFVYRIGARAGVKFAFQTKDAMAVFKDYPEIIRNSGVIPNPVVVTPLGEDSGEGVGEEKFLAAASPEPDRDSRQGAKKISAVGRLEPQKNYPILLRAFSDFCRTRGGYELHIYGKGSLLEYLRSLAVELGIDNSVIFEGFCKDVTSRISDSCMFVLSSDYEGMPNALMEAMALGLCCISTDCPIGGPGMLIKNGENGLLVPVGDENALKEAMEKAAGDDELRKRLGKNAAGISEAYNIERITQLWLDI